MIYIFKLFHFFPLIFLALASQPESGVCSSLKFLFLNWLYSPKNFFSDSPQTTLDPCRRQPFRGRCPPGQNGVQMRSQFVLRYYLRNGECISYPYGNYICRKCSNKSPASVESHALLGAYSMRLMKSQAQGFY